MAQTNVLSKFELQTVMDRFIADKKRGISINMFCEVCGVPSSTFNLMFIEKTYPINEIMQLRVSKGWNAWKNGEIAIMQNQNNTKYFEYRKVPKPRIARGYGLEVVDSQIKLKIGIINRSDYGETLEDQLGDKVNV